MNISFFGYYFPSIVLFFSIIMSYVIKGNSMCQSAYCQKWEIAYWVGTIFLLSNYFRIKPSSFKALNLRITFFSALIFTFLILFNWENLHASLVSDHLYHAQEALRAFMVLAERHCNQFGASCSSTPFASLINLYSRTALLFLGMYFILLIQIKNRYLLASLLIILFLLLLQIFKFEQIQSGDVHPPLRLAPLWLSSAVFGLNPFGFRVIGLVGVGIFSFFFLDFFSSRIGNRDSFLVTLIVVTIPLLQHVAYIVEPSLWTFLSWTGLLLFISFGNRTVENFKLWFLIISMASLMRASAFVALVPLTLFWLTFVFEKYRYHFVFKKEFYITMLPVLVMIPFTFKSIFMGTPATEGDSSKISLLLLSLQSLLPIKVAYYSLMFPCILFFPFGFLSAGKDKWPKFSIKLSFFIFAYIIFYSINPGLWGMSRYQAEFVLPFVVLGIVNVLIFLKSKSWKVQTILALILLTCNLYVSWNFQSFSKLKEENIFAGLRDGRTAGISEIVFDTKEALAYVKERNLLKSTYLDGITYGQFPQIMAQITFSELMAVEKFGHPWGGAKMVDVNANQDIKAIILSDWAPNYERIKILESFRWTITKDFWNPKYNTHTVVMERNAKK
jgi:hypothetical protein